MIESRRHTHDDYLDLSDVIGDGRNPFFARITESTVSWPLSLLRSSRLLLGFQGVLGCLGSSLAFGAYSALIFLGHSATRRLFSRRTCSVMVGSPLCESNQSKTARTLFQQLFSISGRYGMVSILAFWHVTIHTTLPEPSTTQRPLNPCDYAQ